MTTPTKCHPVEMRKNLLLVNTFKEVGLDFVAIPVLNDEHKAELLKLVQENLTKLEQGND